ncbi:MAG: DHHA1 domain-containing protein [Patescibacteria group bacterium]|nr:DHHA1 domain-containing protein [Patescibacteria group bacterium]
MELTPKQQVIELINKSKNILLVTHERPDGDALGSLLAMNNVLNKLDKNVTAVIDDNLADKYKFLNGSEELSTELKALRDFIVSVDCNSATADKLAYNFQEEKLNIVITPKEGSFNAQDVSFSDGGFHFDLVCMLDAANWEQLGKLYVDNPKLFQSIPVINIDHHSTNDYYGTVNLVDLTATSTAEILVGLIEALGTSLIDEEVATDLLTGIISDTGSFQHSNTTPKSLTIAAQMVGLGAKQQDIIKHLFKTKPFTTLKLWGRILSNLKFDEAANLGWGTVPFSYYAESNASTEETGGLIDELMTSLPGANITILLSEKEPNIISGSIRTKQGVNAAEIAALFGGGGHPGAAGFKLTGMTINQAEDVLVEKVKEFQTKKGQLSSEEEHNATVMVNNKENTLPDSNKTDPTGMPDSFENGLDKNN